MCTSAWSTYIPSCTRRRSLIGRIYGAIVAATGRSDRRGGRDDRPVYTLQAIVAATIATRQLLARLNRCSSRRRSPVLCTRGDCRGDHRSDDCRDDRRDSRLVYTLQAIVAATIAPTVAATIAPCIRPITIVEQAVLTDTRPREFKYSIL